MLRPSFVGSDGVPVTYPLHATGPQPCVELSGLARLFMAPVLFGEFTPSSYWQDVALHWPMPDPAEHEGSLRDVFAAAVARACVRADTVAVALSGGIDSLAVAWHALALDPPRRVLGFVADLVDDTGTPASAVVAQLLDGLALNDRIELCIVDPIRCTVAPAWSPFGPRMDALPSVNATIAQLAADAGAQVLLSGNGADELLAVPRYAAGEVAAIYGMRAARRYLRDMACAGRGRTGEYAALAARGLPATTRARAYAAVTWPDWCAPQASPVLAPAWRKDALAWTRQWVAETLGGHAAAGRSWAAADAVDSWWPQAYLPPAGLIAEVSPFCDVSFAAAVWARPLGVRYDPAGRSAYLRVKGIVADLFPPEASPLLPTAKRYYAQALAAAYAGPVVAPTAAAVGLLDPAMLATTGCTATKMTATAVEAWLAGAAAAGFAIAPESGQRAGRA